MAQRMLISAPELLQMIGCSRKTLYNYIERGIIPEPTRILGRRYWTTAQIAEAMRELGFPVAA
jgi:predicted DNA-binding transcriptional regulator AlpA